MERQNNNAIITFNDIKSTDLIEHTRKVIKNNDDEIISFYIDEKEGMQSLDKYYIQSGISYREENYITLNSRIHSIEEKNFIRNIFNKLDSEIDLDFIEMSHNNGSDIDIYKVSNSSTFVSNTIGQAIKQEHQRGAWWDLLWKDTNEDSDFQSLEMNTIIHELGHALGLGHPFNDPFNKNFTTKDTIMSYNEGSDGWDIWFSTIDLQALQSIWGREDDLGSIKFHQPSNKYKFEYKTTSLLFIKTEIGLEAINNIDSLIFEDQVLSVKNDILSVFNELTGIDDITGKIYRLYNAALGRFPDISGFKYWIEKNTLGENSYYQIVESFINSYEFKELYSTSQSDEKYLFSLYNNVLNREPDTNGYNYWLNQIEGKHESKIDVLIGFAESYENKTIFTEETSIMA